MLHGKSANRESLTKTHNPVKEAIIQKKSIQEALDNRKRVRQLFHTDGSICL